MAIWYEVEHSETGVSNFMECNWHFHDFAIERVNYLPDRCTAELFLKYDAMEGSVILRFLDVRAMNVAIEAEAGLRNDIMGSVLLLLENGQFLWADDDTWGEQSYDHIQELKQDSSWVQAERILWAVTDSLGNPTELPTDKIDQTWHIWGEIRHRHFDLTPYKGD